MRDASLCAPGAMLMMLMLGRRLFTVGSRRGSSWKVYTTHVLDSATFNIYLYTHTRTHYFHMLSYWKNTSINKGNWEMVILFLITTYTIFLVTFNFNF